MNGALFVMTRGALLMLLLCVDSSDIPQQVSFMVVGYSCTVAIFCQSTSMV